MLVPPIKLSYQQVTTELRLFGLIDQKLKQQNLGISSINSLFRLTTDSREANEESIFLAYRGITHDGHAYVKQAVAQGCRFIIAERPEALANINVQQIIVSDARKAWAILCSAAYGHPHQQLHMIGITGTNGKSSTVWIIKCMLAAAGIPCLSMGTLGSWLGDEYLPTQLTTPDPPALYYLLSCAVKKNIRVCVMEVSSHAIALEKLTPIKYHTCGFTSFSRDHLDFHHSMSEYLSTKLRLFKELSSHENMRHLYSSRVDIPAPEVLGLPSTNAWLYGREGITAEAPVSALGQNKATYKIIELGQSSTISVEAGGTAEEYSVPLCATYLLDNFLCALLASEHVLGRRVRAEEAAQVQPVPGRMEIVQVSNKKTPLVLVDYAHTPDALMRALQEVRALTSGRVFVVFGCGGDRDKGKRPIMGEIAYNFADRIIVTSDNPRSEKPEEIISSIVANLPNDKKLTVEADRHKAIEMALTMAAVQDVVLIAGKGHEGYMDTAGKITSFDDRNVAKEILETESLTFNES